MASQAHIQAITDKVQHNQQLTREEELLYMTEVLDFTKEEAERVLAINENQNSNLIID